MTLREKSRLDKFKQLLASPHPELGRGAPWWTGGVTAGRRLTSLCSYRRTPQAQLVGHSTRGPANHVEAALGEDPVERSPDAAFTTKALPRFP